MSVLKTSDPAMAVMVNAFNNESGRAFQEWVPTDVPAPGERYLIHVGVEAGDLQHLFESLQTMFGHSIHSMITDGDSWEVWGENPYQEHDESDPAKPDAIHVLIALAEDASPDEFRDLAVRLWALRRALKLVPQKDQPTSKYNGVLVAVTDYAEWSEAQDFLVWAEGRAEGALS